MRKGLKVRYKAINSNTGPATLDVCNLGAKPIIYHETGEPLIGGDIQIGDIVDLTYDGTSWRFKPSLVYINRKISLDSQSGKWTYAEAGGTANALTATLNPKPLALTAGMVIQLKISATNTGGATLNLNGFGAKPIFNVQGQVLAAADLMAGSIIQLVYNGSAFVMTSSPSLIQTGGCALFKTPGAFSWTFPAGVVRVWAEVYGAGGGAALFRDTTDVKKYEGEGGGGGGYACGWVLRPSNGIVTGYIGIAGQSVVAIGAAAQAGGTTTFGGISATGGTGADAFGRAGLGGTGTGGVINLTGQSGGDGSFETYQYVGVSGCAAGPQWRQRGTSCRGLLAGWRSNDELERVYPFQRGGG